MSKLIELIKVLVPNLKSQKELDDAYLAQAPDIFDLERRMLGIEARSRSSSCAKLLA
jgi:hypothetical protein